MKFEITDEGVIIDPEGLPPMQLFEAIAREGYRGKQAVGPFASSHPKRHQTADEFDYSRYVEFAIPRSYQEEQEFKENPRPVSMELDFVNGQRVKVFVYAQDDGTFKLDKFRYELDNGPVEPFIERVQAGLEELIE